MQKFSLQDVQSSRVTCSAYGKQIVEEMNVRSMERLKIEQPRAYYYQMVPEPCLEKEELELQEDSNIAFSYPRRTCTEPNAFGRGKVNTLMETMPFSRDSCSDTDSGICTDNGSECQQSPKHPITGSLSPAPMHPAVPIMPHHQPAVHHQPTITMLPPPSNFKLRQPNANRHLIPASSRIPPPTHSSQPSCSRRGKQPMRVRFADEVAIENASQITSSTSHKPPSASPAPPPPPPHHRIEPSTTSGHYYSMPPRVRPPPTTSRRESPPPLPDYEMAVRRMREIGRHNHHRSVSLPRRQDQGQGHAPAITENTGGRFTTNHKNARFQRDYEDGRDVITRTIPRRTGGEKRISEAKSMENLSSTGGDKWDARDKNGYFDAADSSLNGGVLTPSKSCENLRETGQSALPGHGSRPTKNVAGDQQTSCQPTLPRNRPRFAHCMSSALQKIADHAQLQPRFDNGKDQSDDQRQSELVKSASGTLSRQHTSAQTTQVVHSVATLEKEGAKYQNQSESFCTDRLIETRLLGLDHQGIQLIELRKRDDGPFGFYIATGSFKKKKGIFVSRITVRGLFPLLAVGDQILDVNFQPIKGRSLEEVQRMMGNTDRVILRTLPAVMR